MELVFSDEFEEDGRSFFPGDDAYWEAVGGFNSFSTRFRRSFLSLRSTHLPPPHPLLPLNLTPKKICTIGVQITSSGTILVR